MAYEKENGVLRSYTISGLIIKEKKIIFEDENQNKKKNENKKNKKNKKNKGDELDESLNIIIE